MPDSSTAPLVVMCAPNGASLHRSDHPAVPISVNELADCAASLLPLGVSVLHLHVRDAQGGHSLDVGRYREAMDAIRERVGDRMILQLTTEAHGIYDRHQQMRMVRELKPEAVSLALRELCPDDAARDEAGEFFRETLAEGVWPQYILYDAAEVERFDTLRREGYFGQDQPFVLAVLGRYRDSTEGTTAGLEKLLRITGVKEFPWAVCCIGHQEGAVVARAAELGGHIRVGFESNRWLPDGEVARDNAHLLSDELSLVARSAAASRPIATADWVRRNLAQMETDTR